ncbi:hypothetical protein NFJ02_18g31000 [Pycnococcus provasolii]
MEHAVLRTVAHRTVRIIVPELHLVVAQQRTVALRGALAHRLIRLHLAVVADVRLALRLIGVCALLECWQLCRGSTAPPAPPPLPKSSAVELS